MTERFNPIIDDALFKSLIDSAPDGFLVTDERGRIVLVNAQIEQLFGYDRAELLNQPVETLVPGRFRRKRRGHRAGFMSKSRSRPMGAEQALYGLKKDGREFPVEISLGQVRSGGGVLVCCTVRDVSGQRAVEQRLHHVQKMEEIGRLAGGIVHDFNNVLGVIAGYAEMLAESVAANPEQSALVHKMQQGVEHGASLTRQLLAFSRQQALQFKVLDINGHLRSIEELLRRVIGEDIHLTVAAGEQPLYVRADVSQLEQVILNLVMNGRDAMPNGGKLTIQTAELSADEEYCEQAPEAAPGDYAVIMISDSGGGMSREVMSHLFEPFFTTKEHGKGTGLGLAIVYGIVKQSGGFVNVYSKVGHGTTFRIALPLTEERVEAVQETESADPPAGGSETILLVEDEPGLRGVVAAYLRSKGYTILEASTPGEALQISAAPARAIDLLVTDVVLPEMNGVKLAERVQAQRPGLRTLYISGCVADAMVHYGLRQGDFAFLAKPFSLTTLARKIRSVFGHVALEHVGDPR